RPRTGPRSCFGLRMPGRGWRRSWSDAGVASVAASGRRRRLARAAGGRRSLQHRDARLQRLHRRLFGRFGELHRPGGLIAGIDLEESSAIIAAGETVVGASDGELLFPRAHEGLTRPFATAVIIDGVDVVIARDQRAAQHGLAAARGDVPPALGGPTVVLLVADRDPDPVAGVVAEAEIGKRRRARERPCDGNEGGADQPPHAAQAPWRTRDGRRWN